MSAAITLAGVSKQFSGSQAPALNHVDLELLTGTRTAILGQSGSGKSTLLRLIAGLDEPTTGTVLINGDDVAGVVPERRGIGMVFQRALLFPHLSVLDNVAFALRASGRSRSESRRSAQPYLDLVQLGEYSSRSVASLSGGQQQRVAIARTMAAEPSILLLDEPFSALDPALRADMHALLAELRTELPSTLVVVTHDRDEAAAVSERIVVLSNGAVLQHDTVDRIYHRPASLAVAQFMGGRTAIAGIVADGVHHSVLGPVVVDADTPDGEGLLVIRQECVQIADAAEFSGVIAHVARKGARREATIACQSAELVADLPPGDTARPGDVVRFRFAPGAASVVPI
ncbi:ABC transporter ATP-binding protein [Microbacterium sp. NPDC076911]|uniref:ABC transporter ATP-binding protein n=1 Tax=Microbacterium sp. NPDC076911 TaxID=3154958 RepID=UPI00343998C8